MEKTQIASSLRRVALVILGGFLLLWPSVFNGGPFWFQDTTAYVRGPDLAVQKLLGEEYRTEWSLGSNAVDSASPATEERPEDAPGALQSPLNQPDNDAVMAGRSVYYGTLLYLGHITSDFWFSVLVQCLVISWLVFLVCRLNLINPEHYFLLVLLSLSIFSSMGLFANFLMPDIFAGVTILGAFLIFVYLDRLSKLEVVFLIGSLAIAVTFHATHLALAGLAIPIGFLSVLFARAALGTALLRAAIVGACVLFGLMANLTFELVATHMIGTPPIWPPFLLARSIEDGPAYLFLKDHCAEERFATCEVLDRLPTSSQEFLWSHDPNRGVFVIVDVETRRRISNEQFEIVTRAALNHPGMQMLSMLRNSAAQFATFGVSNFRIGETSMAMLAQRLPDRYLESLRSSRSASGRFPVEFFNVSQYIVVTLAFGILSIGATRWLRLGDHRLRLGEETAVDRLGLLIAVVLLLVVLNAILCGALSNPQPRYQARVIWLLPLLALVLQLRNGRAETWLRPAWMKLTGRFERA